MSTENIPDYQTAMLPLLKQLADGQPHGLADVISSLAKEFSLSDDDLRVMVPSGQQPLFKNRVTWAITYLKNAGLLFYPRRGNYQITEEGKKVLVEKIDRIDIGYLKKFPAYTKWQASTNRSDTNPTEHINNAKASPPDTKTPEEYLGNTINALNEKLAFELLELIKSKPPSYFELFVLQLLSKMGYGGIEDNNYEVVGKSGDNGIDGIIYQDQFGIDRVYIQAKRWTDNKVQSKDIRDFIGSLSIKGTNKGIFITTSDFTDDASKTVLMNPQNRIILINGLKLAEYAIKYNVGVQLKTFYEVKQLDNDFFDEV